LTFPDGIPGFSSLRRWALVELIDDGAFQMLRSLDEPAVEIPVAVPWLFFPDYAPAIDDADQDALGLETADDAVVFCAVKLAGGKAYMNLMGPFIVNTRTLVGRQVVLADSSYPLRAELPLAVA